MAVTTENEFSTDSAGKKVCVSVPARLHFGFLDLDGTLGRRFGSFGMAVEGVRTRLSVAPAVKLSVSGPAARGPCVNRAQKFAETILSKFALPDGANIIIEEAIPEHAGLGSGTQLGLAVGAALTRLHGRSLTAWEIAVVLGRGTRSGIGIGAFEQGGVLLDGGKGSGEAPPPIISRLDFPESWRVLLIFDANSKGLHGDGERGAFEDLPPYPPELSAQLCRLVLMTALPALAEENLDAFGRAITELQQTVGDHFAPAQGGRYASARVAEVLAWLQGQGIAGFGQSSWGPTGFAFFDDEAAASAICKAGEEKWTGDGGLQFMLCRGRNRGGQIDIIEMTPSSDDAAKRA